MAVPFPIRAESRQALRPVAALALLLAASGCAVGPDHSPPSAASLRLPGEFHAPSSDAADQVALQNWWTQFNDPQLSSLVERAIRGNENLAVARARLRAARAAVGVARGAQLPSVGASGSASRQEMIEGSGLTSSSFQAGLDAAWEADLFGGLRRSTEAATATAQSSAASLANVQASLVSELALAYVDARNAQARLAVARGNLAIQDNTLEIVRWRVEAGLVSDIDLQQATTQRAQTAASIPTLEQGYQSAANRIAVLIGEAPGAVSAELDETRPIPLGPDDVATGVPAQLLQRRPDVIAAERSLAAEVARIGVAEAQLYPALRLSGSIGSGSNDLADLGTNIIGNLLGSISAPIFQGGQIRSRIDQQRATADASFSTYRQTVLTAIEDVENALVAIDRTRQREAQLAIAETAARTTVDLANARYQSGLIDFQTLLQAQQSLLTVQDSRTTARAARASASVQLFKALGGGWDPAATALAAAQTGPQ